MSAMALYVKGVMALVLKIIYIYLMVMISLYLSICYNSLNYMTKIPIPRANPSLVYPLRRILGLGRSSKSADEIISWSDFYRALLNTGTDPNEYILQKVERRKETIEAVIGNTPLGGNILEVGCGSSPHSIWLNNKGYKVIGLDLDQEVLDVAKSLNSKVKTNVMYVRGDLYDMPFVDKKFHTAFSHGTLEHLPLNTVPDAINEGLRVADTYVFSFETFFDTSNRLRGDENLLTYRKWRTIISRSEGYIHQVLGSFPYHPAMTRLNDMLGRKLYAFSPVIVFAIKHK